MEKVGLIVVLLLVLPPIQNIRCLSSGWTVVLKAPAYKALKVYTCVYMCGGVYTSEYVLMAHAYTGYID